MTFLPLPSPAADRARERDRRHPERETLELAAAGVALVIGHDHGVTKALAEAGITMAKADLWWARLAVKTLRRGRPHAQDNELSAVNPGVAMPVAMQSSAVPAPATPVVRDGA